MVRYAARMRKEDPFMIPNPGPTPKIDPEEGLPLGALDIVWVEPWRRNLFNWSKDLKWYERLHAHATMNSARRNHLCKRPFEPKDELDFVLESAYDPLKDAFSEKTDVYLQRETAYGETMNLIIQERERQKKLAPLKGIAKKALRCPELKTLPEKGTWRLLRNRITIYPERSLPRSNPIAFADTTGQRRENIFHVKLGIAADHSPQTNPGYSRTPSGAFYAI